MAEASPPVDLVTRDEGAGPVILLLHGVGGSHAVWNEVIPRLVPEFRVLAPDLRGHGRTPAPAGSVFDVPEFLGDLHRLLEGKGVRAAHWVGLSGGALLALRAALEQPASVRSLTMVSGSAYTDAHTRSVVERWAETYAKEGPDAFALRLLKDLYYPDWIEEHLDYADEVRREVAHQDFRAAVRWSAALANFDERNRIATLSRPLLLMQGMDDQVVDASHGRIIRQSATRAQLRLLPQTGHMIPLERPQETAEAIAGLVRATESGTASPAGG
jgi:pimeloyl-ACP methyl ester carboxylesterase